MQLEDKLHGWGGPTIRNVRHIGRFIPGPILAIAAAMVAAFATPMKEANAVPLRCDTATTVQTVQTRGTIDPLTQLPAQSVPISGAPKPSQLAPYDYLTGADGTITTPRWIMSSYDGLILKMNGDNPEPVTIYSTNISGTQGVTYRGGENHLATIARTTIYEFDINPSGLLVPTGQIRLDFASDGLDLCWDSRNQRYIVSTQLDGVRSVDRNTGSTTPLAGLGNGWTAVKTLMLGDEYSSDLIEIAQANNGFIRYNGAPFGSVIPMYLNNSGDIEGLADWLGGRSAVQGEGYHVHTPLPVKIVPDPSMATLLALGAGSMAAGFRRKQKS